MLRAAALHSIEFALQIHKFGSMAQATLSCRYAAIHLCISGIYTREENVSAGRGFSRFASSVVSSERLFGKQSFSTASRTYYLKVCPFFPSAIKEELKVNEEHQPNIPVA